MRWCARFILCREECEGEMKRALPSKAPSKQERAERAVLLGLYDCPRPGLPEAEQYHMLHMAHMAYSVEFLGFLKNSPDKTELMKSAL